MEGALYASMLAPQWCRPVPDSTEWPGCSSLVAGRWLLVAQCNVLSNVMPFLFEQIDDETELLPDNLLRTDSVFAKLVGSIAEDDWKDVEIIGWLYQFYIAEEKERADRKLKVGGTVNSHEIPAKTQLFTLNWIGQ